MKPAEKTRTWRKAARTNKGETNMPAPGPVLDVSTMTQAEFEDYVRTSLREAANAC